jgi:hypothetical protein
MISPKTILLISGKRNEVWHGYVLERKGIDDAVCIDAPIAIRPDQPAYGLRFEDITGPGEYSAPD